jgi:hypothetical protein
VEESFGFREISGAHLVEDESAHFRGAFSHAVEVAGGIDVERLVSGEGLILGKGEASGGFDEFFLGILEVASVFNFGVLGDLLACFGSLFVGLVEEGLGFGEILAVDGFDALAARLDQGSGGFESVFPGGVLGVHFGLELGDGLLPGHALEFSREGGSCPIRGLRRVGGRGVRQRFLRLGIDRVYVLDGGLCRTRFPWLGSFVTGRRRYRFGRV